MSLSKSFHLQSQAVYTIHDEMQRLTRRWLVCIGVAAWASDVT